MGMLYKRGEVFWIKCQSIERPIRQSTGTTKKMEIHRILSKGRDRTQRRGSSDLQDAARKMVGGYNLGTVAHSPLDSATVSR